MIVSDELVARYFAPPREPLWRWSSDGTALVTAGGKTIAFKAEVELVLERLAPRGLPPFGAVVLLLAACRDRWSEDTELRGVVAKLARASERAPGNEVARAVDAILSQHLAALLQELDRIHSLHADLRRTPDGKAFLAETIFEFAPRPMKPPDAEAIVLGLKRGIPRDMLQPVSFDGSDTLLGDLDVLRKGIQLSNEELALRQKTGLDELPLSAEPETPLPDRARKLIEALRGDNDAELSGLARLALDLLAAVHVPRLLTQRDELPLGGFSDIANRGSLDRLLLSELAHDDLTLSVRIALNEALYLRREPPPRSPPLRREILIDSGIRMWGLPRAFAASVALAFVATAGRDSAVRCCRASETATGRGALIDVELAKREGLVAQLSALEPAPHPAAALKHFVATIQEQTEPADAILVTHPDVLDDSEFKSALGKIPDLSLYIATVDREGRFRLLHFTPVGHTVLREAEFPLESIFAPKPEKLGAAERAAAVPLNDAKLDPNLPVILSLEEFPFLLPYPLDPRRSRLTHKGALYAVTNDGRLLRRENPKVGARRLSDVVPAGALRKIIPDGEGDVYVILAPQTAGGRTLTLFHALSEPRAGWRQPWRSVELTTRRHGARDILLQNGLLVLIYDHAIDVFHPGNGEQLATYDTYGDGHSTRKEWVHGRFFRQTSGDPPKRQWFQLALSTPSGRVALIEHPAQDCIALIERRTDDKGLGPWALSSAGVLSPALQGEAVKFSLAHRTIKNLTAASDNGNRFEVELSDGQFAVLEASTGKGKGMASTRGNAFVLEPRFSDYLPCLPVRRQIKGVGLTPHDSLFVVARSGRAYRLCYNLHSDRIELEKYVGTTDGAIAFSPSARAPGTRYRLSVARFRDGSCVFLDSRGLLHLKPSDKTLPEISLVLHDADVACWTSVGQRCGSEFFLGKPAEKGNAEKAYARITQFVRRLK